MPKFVETRTVIGDTDAQSFIQMGWDVITALPFQEVYDRNSAGLPTRVGYKTIYVLGVPKEEKHEKPAK